MATSLTAINQQTEWFDTYGAATDVNFMLEGDFVDAVSLHYSGKSDYVKGVNDYTIDPLTYSSKSGPIQIPQGIRFVRFASGGSWTAGKTCTPRPMPARGSTGQPFLAAPQTNTNSPSNLF